MTSGLTSASTEVLKLAFVIYNCEVQSLPQSFIELCTIHQARAFSYLSAYNTVIKDSSQRIDMQNMA
jgi:hypothetical protein